MKYDEYLKQNNCHMDVIYDGCWQIWSNEVSKQNKFCVINEAFISAFNNVNNTTYNLEFMESVILRNGLRDVNRFKIYSSLNSGDFEKLLVRSVQYINN